MVQKKSTRYFKIKKLGYIKRYNIYNGLKKFIQNEKYSRRINFKDKRGYILDISYKEDFNHMH